MSRSVVLEEDEITLLVSLLTGEARYRILHGEKHKHDMAFHLIDKIERGRRE